MIMRLFICVLCVCLLGCTTTLRFGVGPNADKPTIDFSASTAQLAALLVTLNDEGILEILQKRTITQLHKPLKDE